MSCPHPDVLRLLAEGEPVDDPAAAAHAAACARCARRLDLARAEEAALRAALAAPPPRDLLERTLSAVRDARGDTPARPSRARRAAPRTRAPASNAPALVAAVAVVVLVVAAAVLVARRTNHAPASPPPPPSPTPTRAVTPPGRPPAPEAPKPEAPPPAALPDAPDDAPAGPEQVPHVDDEAPTPDEADGWATPVPESEPEPEPDPAPDVIVRAPTDDPAPDPAPGTSERLVARVRAGDLGALRPGDAVPPGAALRAGRDGAEVEADGAVLVALAPRTTAAFDDEAGGVVVRLERGRAFARTHGDQRAWSVATPEGRLRPLGTALLVQREGARTRAATLEGVVRLEPAGGAGGLDLRPGFEAELARGRPLAPRPLAAAERALAWLPDDLRPRPPAPPALLQVFEFEDGRGRWTKGSPHAAGARGSRGSLRGVPGAPDYAVSVELEDLAGVVTIDPDLWLEAVVRVDRRALVVLQVWDFDRKENLAHRVTVEPGRWTSVAAPLRAFTDPAGAPRGPVVAGGRGTCVTVLAGEEGTTLELLVDDVRVWRQP